MDHLSFIPLTGNTSGREQQQLVINQEYRAIKLALKVVINIYLSQEEAIVKSSNPSRSVSGGSDIEGWRLLLPTDPPSIAVLHQHPDCVVTV
jgi:hypothetical protein